ncbi:hypothetical protein EJB05_20106, partial [Eragrostis curvula]
MTFAQRVANEMGILALVFWTTSACGFMGYLHFKELMDRGYVPLKDESYLTNGYLDTRYETCPQDKSLQLISLAVVEETCPEDRNAMHE